MRVSTLVSIAALLVAGSVAGQDAPIKDHQKRCCAPEGCKCVQGFNRAGQYCGSCKVDGSYLIIEGRVDTHIYECNPTGGCCDYGPSSLCDSTGSPSCGAF